MIPAGERQKQSCRCLRVAPILLVGSAIFLLPFSLRFPSVEMRDDSIFSGPEAYERFMGRWSRDLARLLVRFAAVRDGDAILDVGAGTGSIAAAVASMAPASRLDGVDPTPAYVAFARARHGNSRVRFSVGDARHLPFGRGAFDCTLSALALNFVPDASLAAAEMTRVTRPGGTVAAAVWDYGEGMAMLRVFWDAAIAVRPHDDGKDERHMPLCSRGALTALWQRLRLQQIGEDALTIRTRFSSFDDYWTPFLDGQGPAGQYVARLGADDRGAVRTRLRQALLGNGPDRPFEMTARAWAVRGIVP